MMWAFGSSNYDTAKQQLLEEEKRQQEQLIKEQLLALELEQELKEYAKDQETQMGLVEVAKRVKHEKHERGITTSVIEAEEERRKRQNTSSSTGTSTSTSTGTNGQQQTQQQLLQQAADAQPKKTSYVEMARAGYHELVNAIIRPPRAKYKMESLGPPKFSFCGKPFLRTDLTLMTKRGYKLECSHWEPDVDHRNTNTNGSAIATITIPVLIYMHGNASARVEVLPQLSYLLSLGISVFAFDFAGSGQSDGDYVSLGYFEREDLSCVVTHLRATSSTTTSAITSKTSYGDGGVDNDNNNNNNDDDDNNKVPKKTIALWGRSMGASTALMYGDRDPDIACMILDSPFADLVQLAEEMVEKGREQGIVVPNFVTSAALKMIEYSVLKRANFNIKDISPISHADKCFIPALFVAGQDDDFIQSKHSQSICEKYGGDKNLLIVEGDHNSPRPRVMFDAASSFLQNYLAIPNAWTIVSISPSMNLMLPPWYHNRSLRSPQRPQPSSSSSKNPTLQRMNRDDNSEDTDDDDGDDDVVHDAIEVEHRIASPPPKKETLTNIAEFDSEEMGMTQDRQREIQGSLFKMLGHEDNPRDDDDGEAILSNEEEGGN